MSILTALSVIGLAILFIVTLILEVKSAPMSNEMKDGTEYLTPLTKRQKSYQFSSKLCFYGILGIIFTIVISALENWL
tara:strand:- start:306 stop:539 length:234 start_codon:yes stop_codon:yes gene_type:complete